MDTDIDRIISYWFDVEDPVKKWFGGGSVVDEEIREQFLPLIEKARTSELTSWTEQPKGILALLILLDQFPRNIFRGTPLSYSSDPMALELATKSLAKGLHKEVSLIQEPFFYLPLVHHESLVSQIAGVALYQTLLDRCPPNSKEAEFARLGIGAAEGHQNIIMRFGRFPSRNKILSRDSTPEEVQFLKEHPSGF
jgi:uncharacterized protein (DUF924 family)